MNHHDNKHHAPHGHETEKHLEPTAKEVSVKTENPIARTEPIKEMHAEIASVSADLAAKTAQAEPIKETPSLGVPIAIIIAGILVAGSIIYTGSKTPAAPKDANYQNVASQLKKETISKEVGLDKKAFDACLASGKYTAPIKEISDAGAKAGIQGTPFSVMITSSGQKYIINGAQPIDSVKAMIASALAGETADAGKIDIPPVTEKDFITGNPNAEIKIVEYSDTECPFSKRFHQTMIDIMKEQGPNGKVAWVYRYFPLDGLHQKARYEAEAVACAAEQGGNAKFWEYLDLLFKVTPSNDGLDASLL
jgi:protein-disulfide isomerase